MSFFSNMDSFDEFNKQVLLVKSVARALLVQTTIYWFGHPKNKPKKFKSQKKLVTVFNIYFCASDAF